MQDNVNSKSDQQLIKQFYNEFSLAVQKQMEQSNQLNIIDLMNDLYFFNEQKLRSQSDMANAILNQ